MNGKVALITGSAKGLGKAFAEALLKRGDRIVLSDLNETLGIASMREFEKVYGQDKVRFIKCDVSNPEEMNCLFPKTKDLFGRLDIVCNNAGILHEADWETMIDINLKAMIRGTKLGIAHMGKNNGGDGGVVINISSAAGLNPVPFAQVYCAAKYGVVGFSRSVAIHPDYMNHKVRVNCLCPFFAATDIIKIKKDQVQGIGLAIQTLDQAGVIKVPLVVEGFMELVKNEGLNGAVMDINVRRAKLLQFPPHGFEKLSAL